MDPSRSRPASLMAGGVGLILTLSAAVAPHTPITSIGGNLVSGSWRSSRMTTPRAAEGPGGPQGSRRSKEFLQNADRHSVRGW